MRLTRFLSPPTTSASRPRRRVRLVGLCSSRWSRYALRRRILPVPVILKRLAAPRCVFIFGIEFPVSRSDVGRLRGGLRLRLANRIEHHDHVATVLLGSRLDDRDLGHALGNLLENPPAELRVCHLAAPEHDRQLDL